MHAQRCAHTHTSAKIQNKMRSWTKLCLNACIYVCICVSMCMRDCVCAHERPTHRCEAALEVKGCPRHCGGLLRLGRVVRQPRALQGEEALPSPREVVPLFPQPPALVVHRLAVLDVEGIGPALLLCDEERHASPLCGSLHFLSIPRGGRRLRDYSLALNFERAERIE
jgi:hypothetical protein